MTFPIKTLAIAAALGSALVAGGAAAEYPEKPVRIIVPFSTGGGTDIQGRLLAGKMQQSTGKNFIIDNRTGAGGLIGAQITVESPNDGYTLLFTTATLAVNTTLPDRLEVLSSDPYGEGWIAKIKMSDDSNLSKLMSYSAYQKQCAEEGH